MNKVLKLKAAVRSFETPLPTGFRRAGMEVADNYALRHARQFPKQISYIGNLPDSH